ncbi:MAG: hypothetical protein ABR577_15190 [Pyrinomonadaceae bacterium]
MTFPSRSIAQQQTTINRAQAQEYFAEANVQCRLDGGHLWGVSLCSPLLFVIKRRAPSWRIEKMSKAD